MVRCVIAIILCVPYAAALSALCPFVARSRTRARLHARAHVCCSPCPRARACPLPHRRIKKRDGPSVPSPAVVVITANSRHWS